ncbi:MAG: YicC family protein [Planctomycetota bacterium]|nr:MAG: YicC family protein [Planctomycetota bacterium]
MIQSMTGYGESQHSDGEVDYALEIRSLNNRYFKANIKLPEHISAFESEVEKLLRNRLSRGSVSYNLRMRNTSADAAMDINTAALEKYLVTLNQMPISEHVRIDLGSILALPGVCQPPEIDDAKLERQWEMIKQMTDQALEGMVEMRKKEGQVLRDDLHDQCQYIRGHLESIAGRAPEVLKDYHEKLLQRVNELISSAKLQLELDDIKREVAVYAERCDINEEISRLKSHLEQFENMFNSDEPAGRKLDFLSQEMLRETNTIASKANDADIAHYIVEIKGAIDRIKEQVQNVE